MKKYIILLSLCMMTLSVMAQKNVHWIHGLNSNSNFWARYSNALVDSLYRGQLCGYDSDMTINSIATQVDLEYISTNGHVTTGQSILVGHSAGGLVARSVQLIDPNVKGIVTIGTPNNGAAVVQTMMDKSYYSIIGKLCGTVGNAGQATKDAIIGVAVTYPVISIIAVSATMLAATILEQIASLNDDVKDWWNGIKADVNNVKDQIMAFNPYDMSDEYVSSLLSQPLVLDLNPNGTYIQQLNRKRINVPIINIAGNEDRWQSLRVASSLANQNNILALDSAVDNGFDKDYVDKIIEIDGYLSQGIKASDSIYKIMGYVGWLRSWLLNTRETVMSAKRSYEAAQRYIDVTLDADYTNVLRAYHYETKTIRIPVVSDDGTDSYLPAPAQIGEPEVIINSRFELAFETVTTTIKVYENHDGLVSAHSSAIPTALGVSVKNVTLPGVNHMEMNSNREVRNILDIIFNGKSVEYEKVFQYDKNN